MAPLNAAKVVRRVRQRLGVSQEGLSRLLNATKGAVQHWERGRNNPDLARLLALRQICPPGSERKELDALIRQTQAQVAPLTSDSQAPTRGSIRVGRGRVLVVPPYPKEGVALLRRENSRLQRQNARLQAALGRSAEQVRILEDLASDLHRQVVQLKASQPEKSDAAPNTPPSPEAV